VPRNPSAYYGSDIACINDADELWSEVSGLKLVVQDALHRITCDSVLGPKGADWGYDLHNALGAKQPDLNRLQPRLIDVLTRDDRINTADVDLTAVNAGGLVDISIHIKLDTQFGPFEDTRLLSEIDAL
jgi:hypothetical protein